MKKYIRASELSGEKLQQYIDKVKRNVEFELEDEVESLSWDMRDDEVILQISFLDGTNAIFTFEVWRFTMNPFYISSDIDIIVNTVLNFMKKRHIKGNNPDLYSTWERLKHKSVLDFDGFWTDYTLYVNEDHDRYICIFGDDDFYTPETAEPDFECETEREALEWFDSYRGPGEDDDDWMDEDSIESSVDAGQKLNATQVVVWMYEEFPDWAFYDEHELADGRIMLKFELGPKNQREDLEEALDEKGISYVIRNQLNIFAPEDPEYEGIEGSTSLADDFIRIHDKDEINWQMQDYNYDPFYEELKSYLVEGETWDDEDEEGYPVDTNADLKTLFARMPEDKQKDFLDRFWIHNNSKDYVKSDWNMEDQIDVPDTIGKLNPGDKFKNRKGKIVNIIEPTKDGRVQYKAGDEVKVSSEKSAQQMLYRNNYMRVEASQEFYDMGLGDDVVYWYRTTHGVQPGSVPKGLEINEVITRPDGVYFSTNRVISTDALKYYDIKEKSPYIKSSQSTKKFIGKTYSDLIQDIENRSKYTVDSAYLKRRRGETWIRLYDSKGDSYSAEITEYTDGSFELMEYNITKDVE